MTILNKSDYNSIVYRGPHERHTYALSDVVNILPLRTQHTSAQKKR